MFRPLTADRANLVPLTRVEGWVRARFGLAPDDLVLVSQEVDSRPGFPPAQTLVIFFSGAVRYRLRLFKPVREVGPDDLPVAWMRSALVDDGDGDCC